MFDTIVSKLFILCRMLSFMDDFDTIVKRRPTAELGRAIVRRRKALGLTQRDLAALAGCSEPFLVQLEGGKATVRLEKLLDVLRTLGLELRVAAGKGGIVVGPEL